ncbi:MAG: ABC transporter substrate-binding protein [Pelistega sp.]|nr:ABC transporter substrate-binding protein [Pelistega sp.]
MTLGKLFSKFGSALTVASVLGFAGQSALAQETINIGFSGPLSGGAALYGKNVMDGLSKGVEDVNKKGVTINGKSYKLNLVGLDDKYAPSETAVNARRLVQESKTPFIFVPHSGGIFALQTFNERSKFIIMAYSSLPSILEKKNPFTVRIPESFTRYFPTFIDTQMKAYGKKLGVATTNTDYGKAFTKEFVAAWEAAGGEVVSHNQMSYNASADFYSGVGRTLADKPDVLLIGGPSEPTALVAKQARELGFTGGFIFMDQAKYNEMERVLGDYSLLENSIGIVPIVKEVRPESTPFVEEFEKNHPEYKGKALSSEVILNYAMVHVIANAMELANSADDLSAIYSKMDEAVKKLEPVYNPIQITGFETTGSMMYNSTAAMVKDGKLVRIPLVDSK